QLIHLRRNHSSSFSNLAIIIKNLKVTSMIKKTKKKLNKKHILIVILFATLLFGFRYIWLQYFSNTQQIEVENGEVFITGEKALDDQFQLVGEWAFYPNELLEELPKNEQENRALLQVPGSWASSFKGE